MTPMIPIRADTIANVLPAAIAMPAVAATRRRATAPTAPIAQTAAPALTAIWIYRRSFIPWLCPYGAQRPCFFQQLAEQPQLYGRHVCRGLSGRTNASKQNCSGPAEVERQVRVGRGLRSAFQREK